MQARLSFFILFFSALLLLLASPAFSAGGSGPSDEGVSRRCEAAIDKAAGRYSQCLLKASAKFAKKKNQDDRLFAQQMRCGEKFDNQVARAQDRYGEERCTPYTSQIADRTATCAEEVAMEAGGKAAASRLYVQDATGGTLTETTLVLLGVDESTPWFTDRPYREAGQMTTAEFVALFSEEGANSFAADPPNADFTCGSSGEVVNQVVTLTDPVLDETAGTLTYTVALVPNVAAGGSTEITCDGDAHLFIDDTTATASACTRGYSCFIGGFCANVAIQYPPDEFGYINVYAGHTPSKQPALGAGCSAVEMPPAGMPTDWVDGSNEADSSHLNWAFIWYICSSFDATFFGRTY